jgi:hypothetical protein
MKEAANSEYVVSRAHQDLEVEFEVALKSLQNDQVTIAGYEVELNDLKGTANYAMDCITIPSQGEEPQSVVDRLIDTPNRILMVLKATSLAAATDVLVRVKSQYPDVDMAKVKAGGCTTKDIRAWSLKFGMLPWR